MAEANDIALLREFAGHNSEPAFAELVRRHINLVYSIAMRFTGNDGDAQDLTQAVFIILARKAAGLSARTVVTGWLYETTRFTASRLLRTQARRRAHEQEASMQSILDESDADNLWRQLAPNLEAAMSRLGERDRTLLALRYYENKTGAEAAALLGIREEAARKRTNRALEKLRKFFAARGVNSTAAAIGETISANSVQAVPVGLAKTISAVALAKGAAVSGSTLTLVKGALKIMAWTNAKTVVVAGAVVLLAAGTTTVTVKEVHGRNMDSFFYPTNVWRAPGNLLVFRQTHFTGAGDVMTTSRRLHGEQYEERMMGRNQSIAQAFEVANWMPETETRIVLPEGLPQANFDYLVTLPISQGGQLKALQDELKTKLGLVAHFETREADVLLLKAITPGVIDLQPHPDMDGAEVTVTGGQIHAVSQTTTFLANMVEKALKLPVLDQTGLIGKRYDYDLDEQLFDGAGDGAKVKEFLRDEFGLEVVPSREPVKMLVVEKAK